MYEKSRVLVTRNIARICRSNQLRGALKQRKKKREKKTRHWTIILLRAIFLLD